MSGFRGYTLTLRKDEATTEDDHDSQYGYSIEAPFYDKLTYKILTPDQNEVGEIRVLLVRVDDLSFPTGSDSFQHPDAKFLAKFRNGGNRCWRNREISRTGVLAYIDELVIVKKDLRGGGMGSWALDELWKAVELVEAVSSRYSTPTQKKLTLHRRKDFLFLTAQILEPYDDEALTNIADERARREVTRARITRFYHKVGA
ncbi:hypothetical protein P7C70_g5304, partial [Phenoliferia sp. Uapishka_3]